jgi:nitrate/TMAO reductase-like tetraheme cytochrome c subunit
VSDKDTSERGKLWRWPKSRWLLGIPLGGFLMIGLGAIGLGVTNYALHATSTTEFCFACHSHEVNIRAEYEASSHFRNASGVRAECSNCHLPEHDWFDYITTKMIVSLDAIPEFTGKVDTPEKWEAHRGEMAEKVWAEYRANDSRYCRHCHTPEAMDFELQSQMARGVHQNGAAADKTCIDCHAGLVHKLPETTAEIGEDVETEFAVRLTSAADGGG